MRKKERGFELGKKLQVCQYCLQPKPNMFFYLRRDSDFNFYVDIVKQGWKQYFRFGKGWKGYNRFHWKCYDRLREAMEVKFINVDQAQILL